MTGKIDDVFGPRDDGRVALFIKLDQPMSERDARLLMHRMVEVTMQNKVVGLDIDDQCEIPIERCRQEDYIVSVSDAFGLSPEFVKDQLISETVILPNGQTVTVDSEPKQETWRDREPLL